MKIFDAMITFFITLMMALRVTKAEADESSSESVCDRCKGELCLNGACVNGCKDGYIEPSCLYNCSEQCEHQRCRDSGTGIGMCTDGCIPGYWGETCKSPCPLSCNTCIRETGKKCTSCPKFRNGSLCEGNCRASCPNTGCHINGSCKQESDVCELGKYGPKCQWGCSKGCLYDACNRTSTFGSCLHGCKRGYFGDICGSNCNRNCKRQICDIKGNCMEGCDTGFYGNDCELDCVNSCRRRLCERSTGDCSNGCSDGYYGPQCNATCLHGCPVCHGRTGECLEGFETSITAGNSTTPKPSEANLTGYYVLASVGIFLLCAIITVILAKRFWNTLLSKNKVQGKIVLRKLPDPPATPYRNDYNEINEDEMDQSNQQVGFISADVPRELDIEDLSGRTSEPTVSENIEPDLQEQMQTAGTSSGVNDAASLLNEEIEIVFDNVLYTKRKGCNIIREYTGRQGANSKYLSPVTNQRDVHSV